MKTINVKLSPKGIDAAIRQLAKYRDSIEPTALSVCRTLAENAVPIVDTAYASAKAESGDNKGWTTHVWAGADPHKVQLATYGESVAFWEFGAGLTAGDGYPEEYKGGVDTSPGSWSQSELGKHQFDYINHPYWYYNGVEYDHVTPSKGMYYASRYIEDNAERELRKAFDR